MSLCRVAGVLVPVILLANVWIAPCVAQVAGQPQMSKQALAAKQPQRPQAQPRTVVPLLRGWRFSQGEAPPQAAAPEFDDSSWAEVSVPHTWNRLGNEGLERSPQTNTYQGPGWYRLRFTAPADTRGRRAFLQFDGVGTIADVWLNGRHLGRHEGAFSRFRFDATQAIDPDGQNVLVVKADNSRPQPGATTDHVIPLSGDFFMFGGLYRDVALILTEPVHIDMEDFGGPGVYARTLKLDSEEARVVVTRRMVNDSGARRDIVVETRIEDAAGQTVDKLQDRSAMAPGTPVVHEDTLRIAHPHLWRGVKDPHLYRMVVSLRSPGGELLDEVAQPLGLRTLRFDPQKGFFLNGEPYRLVGASLHQDRPGKGWAISRADQAQDFDFLQELGATAVRLAHYQHDPFTYDLADARGIIAWAEIPLVNEVSFDGSPASEALTANARQQLTELIRQNMNHPSIAVWSIANEIDLRATSKKGPGRAGSLVKTLNALAKSEDPSRPTTLADCCEQTPAVTMKSGVMGSEATTEDRSVVTQPARDILVGLTDVVGYNRYFGWYQRRPEDLGPYLDDAHARHPQLPLAVSEYGAGAGITQHTDNPLGGRLNPHGRPHPEEVQMWFHEQSWPQLRDRGYLWAVFIWNLFDFASDSRNEGDLTDINEKGLVTYDRGVRKDVFYYYKANWSDSPTLHLTGRRFVDRVYGVVDVKAYTNAAEAGLSVNGKPIGNAACSGGICLWPGVHLDPGLNTVVATATSHGMALRDELEWLYAGSPSVVRIKAGSFVGVMSATGERYGSDNFFSGGEGRGIDPPDTPAANRTPVRMHVPELYDSFRQGTFEYDVPLPNGRYTVRASFVEPAEIEAGKRIFDVVANGRVALPALDVFAAAGGKLHPLDREFAVEVTDGRLRLEFRPKAGQAAVSALAITPAGSHHRKERRADAQPAASP